MTAQDLFPKVAGDILYQTEVNDFANSGRIFVGCGSFTNIGSAGPAYQTVGSVVIGAGSLVNYSTLNLYCRSTPTLGLQFELSGVSSNAVGTLGDTLSTGNAVIRGTFSIGSPGSCYMQTEFISNGTDQAFGRSTDTELANFYPGSTTVLFFRMRTATNSTTNNFYGISLGVNQKRA